MLWVTRRWSLLEATSNQRRSYRQSIELPIAITVAGLPAPVYGKLINISDSGCRMRSLILIDRGRDVEFELKRPGHPPMSLLGRIITRSHPRTGGGYEYGMTFTMTQTEKSALVREIQDMQRREAVARATSRKPAITGTTASAGKQRRSSVRALIGFPIRFRLGTKLPLDAEANDISTGGLRLICAEKIPTGSFVAMRFTLPSSMLWVYPHPEERTEITPFGPRRIRIPDNRRPFEEMTLHGRIVSRFAPTRGREVYGVAFIDIDGYQREEIARFTHAVQLAKLRTEYTP